MAVAEYSLRGAGGKNADLTSNLVQVVQETIGLECCMHLCCTESRSLDRKATSWNSIDNGVVPKEKVEWALAVCPS